MPASYEGRQIRLFIGGLNNQGWVWVNGQITGYQPYHAFWQRWQYHHEIDITDRVRFGEENHLSIRVLNDYNFGGMFRRSFIYSPTREE